ncbi:GNAT family N-acetyltransferase [Photobacterium frigidiphilum]|uniref:GNAT family N-acetyltransferase n=1 Tax=Photobacterium frigidiphilum TaxID=264736 RepID=UPI003D0B3BB7
MQWQCLSFNQLSTDQLYDLIKLRIDIFVVEQNCPFHDLDNLDRKDGTHHLLGYKNDELVAYLRLLPAGTTYDNVSMGRVATSDSARGTGIGHQLLIQGLEHAELLWPKQDIDIGAQEHLQAYYKQHGFNVISTMYLEDDIPHVDMRLTKS